MICHIKIVIYHYVIKRELNRRLIYECRCDERPKGKTEHKMSLPSGVYLQQNSKKCHGQNEEEKGRGKVLKVVCGTPRTNETR
jgi:hypothetical protein